MSKRVIISGGGTGGHIFPAVSIGSEIRKREPDASVLFVGAKGGMELRVVPKYDFSILPVWISGIQRRITIKNVLRNAFFPLKLIVSLIQANRILSRFKPQLVVGVGGYASGPLGKVAGWKGIPLVVCEQNAYPGLTNKWLAPGATRILLGNEAASKYFDPSKTIITGNPIREFRQVPKREAAAFFGLDPEMPVVLSLGGSLGARSLNQALEAGHSKLLNAGVQLIWQCGKQYAVALKARVQNHRSLRLMPFIDDMAMAYGAADLVVSRAGGSTISELIALSKPAILVPSPNVAEDHQTMNALSLSDKGAAVLVADKDASEQLVKEAMDLLKDTSRLKELKQKIAGIEKHDAAKEIVDEIFELIED